MELALEITVEASSRQRAQPRPQFGSRAALPASGNPSLLSRSLDESIESAGELIACAC